MQRVVNAKYSINGKDYFVSIIYKTGIKNMYLKPNKDGSAFKLTCHYLTKREVVDKFINKVIEKLDARVVKPKSPYIKDKVYLFSNLVDIQYTLMKSNYTNGILYLRNENDLNNILKSILLEYIQERVSYYSNIMEIKNKYKIVIKNYKGRYGTNFGTKKLLSFALNLVHFSNNVIDSVIVHELAHDKERNHSDKFYEVVLKYFPQYYKYHDALVKLDYECK